MTLLALFVGLVIGFGICASLMPKIAKNAYLQGIQSAQKNLTALLKSMPEQDQDRFNKLATDYLIGQINAKFGDK